MSKPRGKNETYNIGPIQPIQLTIPKPNKSSGAKSTATKAPKATPKVKK